MSISSRDLRYLRGLCHRLQPVVTVADRGLTPNVLTEIETALKKHELIKVKLRVERNRRRAWVDEIGAQCKAQQVQLIGQVACFFRRNTEKPIIKLPAGT